MPNRVALVTGSTSGIGWGIAECFARANYDIALTGFGDAADIEQKRQTIEALGVACRYFDADLARGEDAQTLVTQVEAAFGQFDILVNNAGVQYVDLIENFPDEKWDAVIAINLSAAFHTSKAAISGMKQRCFGRIINIASAHGLVASPQKAAYVAAKHGLVGLTKVIAQETVDYNITCNAICPGWVDTPLVRAQIEARANANGTSVEQETHAVLTEKQPKATFTTPEDIGRLAVFLADEHNQTITGSSYTIDGGWTSQ